MDASRNSSRMREIKKHAVLADLQQRCTTEVTRDACYRQFEEMGFHYGPAFQTIEQLWLADNTKEALGRISIPEASISELAEYHLHPIVLDACFQMVLPLGQNLGETSMPVGVDHIQISGQPIPHMWCYATIVQQTASAVVGNILLFDENGTVLVEVQGFRVQSLDKVKAPFSSALQADTWLYEPLWRALPRVPKEETLEETAGRWLIFADSQGVAAQLVTHLESHNQKCVLITPGQAFGRSADSVYTIRPTQLEDYGNLLNEALAVDNLPCRGVLHLWSLDALPVGEITPEFLQAAQDISTFSVMYLVQALAQTSHSPRLWLLTRGAQSVGVENILPSIAQTPLWGMGRVMYEEFVALRTTLVDLDPASPENELETLFADMWQPDEESQIAWRGNERYVLRLEHMHTSETVLPPYFHPDGSYLITGGFGALGRLVAHWMVEHGARHLILMGRTNLPSRSVWHTLPADHPDISQVHFIHDLEAQGTSVNLAVVDITDINALSSYLADYQQEDWPAIRGVVHAAGAVKDQILWHMDEETFNIALRPKMLGTWALHWCLRKIPLDFFTLFSSISDLVVFTGQSNYSAGNAFVDSIAYYRRMQGLPAQAINWGPWKVGMIAQLDLEETYKQRGIEIISPEQGIYFLTHLFSNDAPQVAVISADWLQVFENYNIIPSLIRHLGETEGKGVDANEDEESLMQTLQHTESAEWQAPVVAYLREMVARVLHIEQSRLDVERSLNALGMDSMMAVELKNRIEQGITVNISVVDLLQGASVTQLADLFIERLHLAQAGEQDVSSGDLENLSEEVDDETLAQLLQQIERMSPEELQEQLASAGKPKEVGGEV